MARITNSELLQRIAQLESENATLREAIDNGPTQPLPPVDGTTAATAAAPRKHTRSWAWTLLATVLILIGALLAPVSVIASWAKVQLTDTDAFVAAYAPLAKDPGVQSFITSETMDVIQQNVDVPAITSQVVDGITSLGTGPAATRALEALKGPAAQGIISLMRSTVDGFVRSDAFAQVWQEALRTSHAQLVATMQNDPKAAIAVGSDGSVGVQLGPIIDRVKEILVKQGLTFASQIPSVDRTITIAQNSSLPTIQLFYGVAVAAGAWLPWVALLFLAAGVVVARRRGLALVWAAVALAISMVIIVAGIAIGRLVFVGSVSPSLIPAGVARTVFDTLTTAMKDTGVAVLVLAIVVAVVAWYSGPFGVPRKLRGFFGSGVAWVREAAERHGITTGRTGEWIYAQRALLRAAVAVIAAAIVLFVRPLTPGLIIWTLVIAAVVVAILELVQRPVITVPETADDETPIMTVS
ncbi:hypothetical protein ASE16_11235 [Leifsonia sp. Root227]|uniref:hypothetical protein n=1 Tax=Leifsonia sp. Root227 TaxID=1736496 RepID=UPI0006F97A66|nr:hypothetical protein [Leifsonia sp. Root227]KRC49326.1 hypothetical protein ASE16_11235 [Leifsonia sp. Root227]